MNSVKINTKAIPKIEVTLLCSTILDAVQIFYKDPQNVADFEAWKDGGNRTKKPPAEVEL